MVAIVSGNELGLFNSSLNLLGSQGPSGQPNLGRSGERIYLNSATGNLIVQQQDEVLVGLGPDVALLRTYNSAGRTIRRVNEDGSESLYTYDVGLGVYFSPDGDGAHDTLKFNALANQWTWTDGSLRNTETYNSARQLIASRDLDGNTTTYTYTGTLLTQIADASGQSTFLDYIGNNLSQIRTVSQGVTQTRVRYSYDTLNRLTRVSMDLSPQDNSIVDGKVSTTTYTYDGTSKRVASITEGDGTAVSFTYVQVGTDFRVATITDALGQVTSFVYFTVSFSIRLTDPLGSATLFAYDAMGRLTGITGPAVGGVSQVVSYAYDASSNVTSMTDARGNVITYQYDANGNRIQERDAAGNTIQRVFGAKNELLAETVYSASTVTLASATGETWTLAGKAQTESLVPPYVVLPGMGGSYASAPDSPAISVTGDLDLRMKLAADDWTPVEEDALISNFVGGSTVNGYMLSLASTGQLRLNWAEDATNTRLRSALSTVAVSAADGTAKWVRATLDIDNGLAGCDAKFYTSDDGVTWTQLGATVAQAGVTLVNDGTRPLHIGLQANGLTWPLNGKVYYAEVRNGIDGAVVAAFNPAAAATRQPSAPLTNRYVYDANNHLRFTVSAEGLVTEYRYNASGRRIAAIGYTASRYTVSTLAPSATLSEANLTAWLPADRSASIRTDTAYDFRGQVASTITYKAVNAAGAGILDGTEAVTQYVYDQAGNLLKTIDPRGTATTYVYDGLGRLLSTTDALGRVTLTQYDDANRKTVLTLANGLITTSTYDTTGRLISVLQSANSLGLGETKYFYDADGRLRRTEDPTGIKTHILYDEAGRKVAVVDGDGSLTEFLYNADDQVTKTLRYATAVSAANLASLIDLNGKPTNVEIG